MIAFLLSNFNLTQFLVLVAFGVVLACFNRNNINHVRLLSILFVCVITETISTLLIYSGHYAAVGLLYSITVIIHHSIWLVILVDGVKGTLPKLLIPLFIVTGLVNLAYFEGMQHFNYYTYVLGALIYVAFFLGLSFKNLKEEKFEFFQSNTYILLFAPVMLFLGLSFIFCFSSFELSATVIFNETKLYNVINYLVNIVYYTFIVVYIYKDKKRLND